MCIVNPKRSLPSVVESSDNSIISYRRFEVLRTYCTTVRGGYFHGTNNNLNNFEFEIQVPPSNEAMIDVMR